ncbi:MAG: SAM-dependent methyltransferase [Paludibacter sp.]|nr:SAM-dependent methyltransferase [Bacteroidales bacterium]MCM1069528.1 SAM-dependent methyltransferase [Prevotella sp.]MCM1403798.1 SAM-dependent methyltransferase [Bacteroides sp.]MCM1443550.1 SAM-dependent methyltransferase [Muribaculum sp.]MCM1482681.1 SAM-dependent methyltransferase [Paludibacter sp.]
MTATEQFIQDHAKDDINRLALQRNRYPEVDIDFALQQIEGLQRTKDKLPTISTIIGWQYPKRISIEQCSSEETARYKATLLQGNTLTDLTGGFGIDTFFLSENFKQTHYVERQTELCKIAQHNFGLTSRDIEVHNSDSTDYLHTMSATDAIYIDPARRSATGSKVFRIEDCEPNIVDIYDLLRNKCSTLLIKLSPMLDISAALQVLPDADAVHIVGVKGEVKETLICCHFHTSTPLQIHTINILPSKTQRFTFTPQTEKMVNCRYATQADTYLYEPNLCILKAGAFKSIATEYNLRKLSANTHLYTSERLIEDFPGRIFRILSLPDKKALHKQTLNVITRNYPQAVEVLRQQLKIKEGGTNYLIGTRIADKPILLLAERAN